MRMWDLTIGLRDGSRNWPGEDRELRQRWLSSIAGGDRANTSVYSGSVHLGTHIDAPLHFVDEGVDISRLDPSLFLGPATVVEIGGVDRIRRAELGAAVSGEWPSRLLIKTRNSAPDGALHASEFDPDYCAVEADAASLLVEKGVALVGIDAYSVAPFDDLVPTHKTLLGAGVPVLEGLDLGEVEPGDYTLIALPLKLEGFEGSPVRAVLVRDD